MPVSKKRKKDGKPVHRREPLASPEAGEVHPPEGAPLPSRLRTGKPSNPFVAQQQAKRGSQRGR
jgi:hypothetical protein